MSKLVSEAFLQVVYPANSLIVSLKRDGPLCRGCLCPTWGRPSMGGNTEGGRLLQGTSRLEQDVESYLSKTRTKSLDLQILVPALSILLLIF